MTESTGITDFRGTVVRLFSPEGTLVVYVDDPGVNVIINGEGVVINGNGAGQLRLKPGRYRFLARKGDRVLKHEPLTIERNGLHVVQVSQEPATVPAASAPPLPAKNLGPWGQFLDPRGGSRASREGDRLTITVPGDTPRDLNPIPGFSLDAPRVLQPVDTDFTIQVTVLPFPRPGPQTTYTTGADSYHGAGLLVWIDARNLLRFRTRRTGSGRRWGAFHPPRTVSRRAKDGRRVALDLRGPDVPPGRAARRLALPQDEPRRASVDGLQDLHIDWHAPEGPGRRRGDQFGGEGVRGRSSRAGR